MAAIYIKPVRLKNYLRHEKSVATGAVYLFLNSNNFNYSDQNLLS